MLREDMKYADPALTWAEWLAAHDTSDETTKLLALHEYILVAARYWVRCGEIGTEWANKKLAKLGITERLPTREVAYVLSMDVTAHLDMTVYAFSRVEALEKAARQLDGKTGASVSNVVANGTPVFTSGPEDVNPEVVDPTAPTTADDTLVVLREVIMYGVIAGPKYCDTGANRVLDQFGLAHIPARKTFVVERPVAAVMRTSVEAFDEESAERVAGWRWENNRRGYEVCAAAPMDVPDVIPSV